jgi:hypothetical protein
MPVVADESKLAKFIHEEADAGSGGTDHFRQHFLADVWRDRRRAGFFLLNFAQKEPIGTIFIQVR